MSGQKINKKLGRDFFERDTLVVARELLGKLLVRRLNGIEITGKIIETEAYVGTEDKACHARHGKTKRNEVMWGKAGHTYIYLCMGLHNLLNIVTEKEGYPAAVLIRKIEPLTAHFPTYKSYGPGNLTKYLGVNRSHNALDIATNDQMYILNNGFNVKSEDILLKPRVGIDYAEEYKEKPWRFVLDQN